VPLLGWLAIRTLPDGDRRVIAGDASQDYDLVQL
jgi:hypothetical protein